MTGNAAVTAHEPITTAPTGFVRDPETAERIARLRSRPDVAMGREERRAARVEMNRAHAMNLAMIRKAADLTQAELAERLGTDQSAVSRLERRDDMLLSTLASYLTATGAEAASLVVTVHGLDYTFDLGHLSVVAEVKTFDESDDDA